VVVRERPGCGEGLPRGNALVPQGRRRGRCLCAGQDYDEAMRWFRKAADQGNAAAQDNLGWLYETGSDVARDYGEAMHWYRKAADQRQ
jgi:TPR repeat protein